MRSLPYPLRWYCGKVRIQATLYPSADSFSLLKYPIRWWSVLAALRHAVEEERIDVVVEGFVVEEEFGEEAEVATPGSLPPAVDLEEGDVLVAVDFVPRWVQELAFCAVAGELRRVAEVAEAEFADVDEGAVGEFGWVGGEVPGLYFVGSHLHPLEIANAGDLRLVLGHAASCPQLLDLLLA